MRQAMKHVVMVYRAERFSPNSVGRDRAIIDAVEALMKAKGHTVTSVNENELDFDCHADVILTMARSPEALDILRAKEAEGCAVKNSPYGVMACRRSNIDSLMRAAGLPAAPLNGNNGYWLKRGDEAAQNKEDVVFAKDENEKNIVIARFNERGVTDIVVTAHVVGDLVKFYGVRNTAFFRTFYPGDNGWSKFGDETVNGLPHHYTFPVGKLWQDADKLASLAGVDIYGGDCIVKADGTYAIIDFNDWPSFAVCRDDAAEAIAMIAERQADKKVKS